MVVGMTAWGDEAEKVVSFGTRSRARYSRLPSCGQLAARRSPSWKRRVTWDEAVRCGGRKPIRTRWVDVNKGDEASPDVRARLVAQDFALGRDDSFYAATPPLEALRLFISDLTTGQGGLGGGPVKLMLLDAKKAHLHAAAERDLFISLPAEAGGGCARLLRSLYGTRDAPALWEAFAAAQLQQLGFVRGSRIPVCSGTRSGRFGA